jgi:AraC family transcriptional regulator, ethanolamine operon transcriptional activator
MTIAKTITHSSVELRHSRDIEEQASLLGNWHQSYCQISRGHFDGSVTAIETHGVRILVERMNRVVFQRGYIADKIAVGVPFQMRGHASMCGQASHTHGLHVFSGDREFELVSPDCYLDCNVELDPSRIRTPLAREGVQRIAAALPVAPGVMSVDHSLLQTLRARLMALFEIASATPDLLVDEALCARHAQSIVLDLAALLEDEISECRPPRGNAARDWALVAAARELIESAPTCPLSVAELGARLDVSTRTLHHAFRNALDVKPVDYLRAARLNRVRRELLRAQPVTRTAVRWGFLHFGRFSQDYRAMFGELPSQTMRRSRVDSTHVADEGRPLQ